MLLIGISDSVHFLLLKPNANIGCANMFVSESVGSRALFAQVFVGVRRFRSMKSDRRQVWPHRRVQALVNTPYRMTGDAFSNSKDGAAWGSSTTPAPGFFHAAADCRRMGPLLQEQIHLFLPSEERLAFFQHCCQTENETGALPFSSRCF